MKIIKFAAILIFTVFILLGTFRQVSSLGVVPWFQLASNSGSVSNLFINDTPPFRVYLPLLLRDDQAPILPTATNTPIIPPATPILATPTNSATPNTTPISPTPIPSTPTNTATPNTTPIPWINIMTEDFEGIFPGAWTVFDDQPGFGEYYWGKRDCRGFNGDYSGWAIGGGLDGSALPCGSSYPENVKSWMIYGPFSLADAMMAELRYEAWVNTGGSSSTLQNFCRMASIDGINFSGDCYRGNSVGGIEQTLDLSNVSGLGSLLGQSNVYIALYFENLSTMGVTEGVYVEDIILRKCTAANCSTSVTSNSSSGSAGLFTYQAVRSLDQD